MKPVPLSGLPRIYRSPRSRPSSGGFALVLVLAMLVLVTVLVVALLQTVKTDVASASAYERGASTRVLAETSVNLVIGQIQEATQRQGEAWVSQPGLIRTFDTNGNPAKAYKLYSADQMSVDGAFDPAAGADLPADPSAWKNAPNQWVDLNEPLVTTQTDSGGNLLESFLYPVVDPRAEGMVEGFEADITPGDTWKSDTTAPQSVAMPVKWLYLLQDGTLSPGVPAAGKAVSIAGMSATNPAIARLAFWADDETAKVNINTASEGTPWDTPVCNTHPLGAPANTASLLTRPAGWPDNQFTEFDFAHFQPSQHEFQRYPGHPATTSLSTVFFGPIAAALSFTAPYSFSERVQVAEEIFKLTPRFSGGASSSEAGTRRGSGVLQPGAARLYASLDELLYKPSLAGSKRVETSLYPPADEQLRRQFLERAGFFLTANSKAPEVNLFNKPRIATWPIHVDDSDQTRTGFDRLVVFCGTIGASKKPYYITRGNPLSKVVDWSERNAELHEYLFRLLEQNVPGFGKSFDNKLDADRAQVITEIFDYIRCLNLQDPTVSTPFTPAATQALGLGNILSGMVLPLEPTSGTAAGTKGVGRIPTVTELALPIIAYAASGSTPQYFQIAVYPELFCPMAGYSSLATNIQIRFTELSLKLNGTTITFPDPNPVMAADLMPMPGGGAYHGQSRLGGYMGVGTIFEESNPPVSDPITPASLPPAPQDFTIDAGSRIAFEIWSPNSGGTPMLLQKFDYVFPLTLPFVRPKTSTATFAGRIGAAKSATPQGAFQPSTNSGTHHVDSIVSLVPAGGMNEIGGDYRLVSLEPSTGNIGRFFGSNGDWVTGEAHSLRSNAQQRYSKARWGNLVSGIPDTRYDTLGTELSSITSPDVPRGINGVRNSAGSPGDWDNGPGLQADGPYVNKADEGTVQGGDNMNTQSGDVPYIGGNYATEKAAPIAPTVFSPNRQMPSAVMLGSLPTGVKRNRPWQTLLFRPARNYLPGGGNHPGSGVGAIPDHVMLDLFWMPVVEPYAISEPFSTAGKINMNYQVAPFNYIRRDTGLRAVFSSARMIALNPDLPAADGHGDLVRNYKRGGVGGNFTTSSGMPLSTTQAESGGSRRSIDADATLSFFDQRFSTGKPFISASEICDVPLVPSGLTASTDPSTVEAALGNFWPSHRLTGDNSLERPYAHIYPRLTTKSNTFTVHVRAQRIQMSKAGLAAGQFDETKGVVTGEFRGSFTIERFLDPNSDSLVKESAGGLVPATENEPDAFLGPYKFRILNTKQLAL